MSLYCVPKLMAQGYANYFYSEIVRRISIIDGQWCDIHKTQIAEARFTSRFWITAQDRVYFVRRLRYLGLQFSSVKPDFSQVTLDDRYPENGEFHR